MRYLIIIALLFATSCNAQSWTPSKLLKDTVPGATFILNNFKIMDYKDDSNYCAVTLLLPDSTIEIEGDTMRCIKMLLLVVLDKMNLDRSYYPLPKEINYVGGLARVGDVFYIRINSETVVPIR